jgi:hypothetical protein
MNPLPTVAAPDQAALVDERTAAAHILHTVALHAGVHCHGCVILCSNRMGNWHKRQPCIRSFHQCHQTQEQTGLPTFNQWRQPTTIWQPSIALQMCSTWRHARTVTAPSNQQIRNPPAQLQQCTCLLLPTHREDELILDSIAAQNRHAWHHVDHADALFAQKVADFHLRNKT